MKLTMVTHGSARGGDGARPLTPVGELEVRKLADKHVALARTSRFSPRVAHVASSSELRCVHTAVEFIKAYPEYYSPNVPIRTDSRLTEGDDNLSWENVVTVAKSVLVDPAMAEGAGIAMFVHGDLAHALVQAGLHDLPFNDGGFFKERPVLVVVELSMPGGDATLVAAASTPV